MNLHLGAKPAALDARDHRARLAHRRVVGALRLVGRHGAVEARTTSAPQIPVQRELADEQQRAADVDDAERHLPGADRGVVFEDAKVHDLREHPGSVAVGIPTTEAQVDEESALDRSDGLVSDLDARAPDALDDGSHGALRASPERASSRASRAVTSK